MTKVESAIQNEIESESDLMKAIVAKLR